MSGEEHVFLDLDIVAQKIPTEYERGLFQEAVTCYHVGSRRAAIILAWLASAHCLRRMIDALANEGDLAAKEAQEALKHVEGFSSYEETLVSKSRKLDLLDDYEEKCVRFVRDTRNKCAHPTGIVPPAEGVRYLLYVCSQYILCRTSYRGVTYIREVIDTRFENMQWLADESKVPEYCKAVYDKVPHRLWHSFAKLTVRKSFKGISPAFRINTLLFFRELLANADDTQRDEIVTSLRPIQRCAAEMFSTLVGLDYRLVDLYDESERASARAALQIQLQSGIIDPHVADSWSVLCARDGFGEADKELLVKRLDPLSIRLARCTPLLETQREPLVQLLADALANDDVSAQATAACMNLFPTKLFAVRDSTVDRIVAEIISRFQSSERHAALLGEVRTWHISLLVSLLSQSQAFMMLCDEDRADDLEYLFTAAQQLAQSNSLSMPASFEEAIVSVLEGHALSSWASPNSTLGDELGLNVGLLVDQYPTCFPLLAERAPSLLPAWHSAGAVTDDTYFEPETVLTEEADQVITES